MPNERHVVRSILDRKQEDCRAFWSLKNQWKKPLLPLIIAFLVASTGCGQGGGGGVSSAQSQGQCTVGVSAVPCMNSLHTVVVAQDGTGNYTTIQPALSAAQPGDVIEVKDGTYPEALTIAQNGEPNYPIMLVNYPGSKPVIALSCTAQGQSVNLAGNWLVLNGFEIVNGWDGVDVYGSNNLITNNYIHDNCGQGILVASAHDVAIDHNRIESNGLLSPSNSHIHGIYFSDYYMKGMYNLTVSNNSLSNHAGAGIQSWDPTAHKKNLLVQNNSFNSNAFEIIFTNTDSSLVTGNTFTHDSYPTTTFSQSAILWLELDTSISFSNNTFHYGITQPMTGSTANDLIYTNQPSTAITFSGDTWQLPPGFPVTTDATVNSLFSH